MDFNKLNETIPYAKGGKEKVLRYSPYPNITLAMPGRHALDTVPVGGDFVVMVTDPVFKTKDHQFTHTDIFKDIELKSGHGMITIVMKSYFYIVTGTNNFDPGKYQGPIHDNFDMDVQDLTPVPGIEIKTLLCAAQCLAVAEHRRYAQYESKFGGRYLPFRFAAGIAEGLWTAADAANLQRRGRPGVEMLEKQYGIPQLTQELMK